MSIGERFKRLDKLALAVIKEATAADLSPDNIAIGLPSSFWLGSIDEEIPMHETATIGQIRASHAPHFKHFGVLFINYRGRLPWDDMK